MGARLLQKLTTGNSSIGKETSWFTSFEGRILKERHRSATPIPCSVKYFLEVCAHFLLKIATKDSFRYKKSQKIIISDAKTL